jgi:hypothetical protein
MGRVPSPLGEGRVGSLTCWFNPNGEARPADLKITYEIESLRELFDFKT